MTVQSSHACVIHASYYSLIIYGWLLMQFILCYLLNNYFQGFLVLRRDGASSEASLVGDFSGSLANNGSFRRSLTTTGTAAHLVFISNPAHPAGLIGTSTGFELHWEPSGKPLSQLHN